VATEIMMLVSHKEGPRAFQDAALSSPTYGDWELFKRFAGAANVLGRLTALILISSQESAAKQYPSR